jgi:hypothetical protein
MIVRLTNKNNSKHIFKIFQRFLLKGWEKVVYFVLVLFVWLFKPFLFKRSKTVKNQPGDRPCLLHQANSIGFALSPRNCGLDKGHNFLQ